MVKVTIYKNKFNQIISFSTLNHAKDKIICSAISMIVLNTINSIEYFTSQKFIVDIQEKDAYIHFELTDLNQNKVNDDCNLLLNSLLLGLESIKNEYKNQISIEFKEV